MRKIVDYVEHCIYFVLGCCHTIHVQYVPASTSGIKPPRAEAVSPGAESVGSASTLYSALIQVVWKGLKLYIIPIDGVGRIRYGLSDITVALRLTSPLGPRVVFIVSALFIKEALSLFLRSNSVANWVRHVGIIGERHSWSGISLTSNVVVWWVVL